MGNTTKEFAIWSPDENDTVEADVWSAAMADSIENGMGARVLKQEQVAHLRASLRTITTVPTDDHKIVPVDPGRSSRDGGFNDIEGIEMNGSVAKILTSGQYFFSCASTATIGDEALPLDVKVEVNGSDLEKHSTVTSTESNTTLAITGVVRLYEGDTFAMLARVGRPDVTPDTKTIAITHAFMNLTMLYAI